MLRVPAISLSAGDILNDFFEKFNDVFNEIQGSWPIRSPGDYRKNVEGARLELRASS